MSKFVLNYIIFLNTQGFMKYLEIVFVGIWSVFCKDGCPLQSKFEQ